MPWEDRMRDPRLNALEPPPPGSEFDSLLWDRIELAQRRNASRWRLGAVATACLAIAGITAAGVFAVGDRTTITVDRTLSCPTSRNNDLSLFAHVRGPSTFVREPSAPGGGKRFPHPALLELDANRSVIMNGGLMQVVQTTYAGIYAGASVNQKAGYTLDGSVCDAAKPIPFSSAGLRSAGSFTGSQAAGVYRQCVLGQPATLRLRVTLGRSGLPVAAKFALRGGKKKRPIAYIDWTPTRIRAWLAPGCQQYTQFAP
jgi:hypothetical protein